MAYPDLRLFRIVRGESGENIVSNSLHMLPEEAERLVDDLRKEFEDDTVRAEQRNQEAITFPEHVKIPDPVTGRPIGLWR